MNKEKLNEKLAVEVMGWIKSIACYWHDPEGERATRFDDWNPIEDLNQLKMCYGALTLEQKQEMWRLISFWAWEKEPIHLADIFDNSEDYARAILEAKRGSQDGNV